VLAWAATTVVSIVAAPIVEPMCVEVWVQQPLVQPPLVQQWRPRITMAAIITVLGAGIIRIRPAIELHRDADKAGYVLSKRRVGKSAKRRAHQSVSGTSDVPLSAAQDRRRSVFLYACVRRPWQRSVNALRCMNAWSIRAFTPVFDGLWRFAPLSTLRLLGRISRTPSRRKIGPRRG
jgi:hypothetical protein